MPYFVGLSSSHSLISTRLAFPLIDFYVTVIPKTESASEVRHVFFVSVRTLMTRTGESLPYIRQSRF